MILFSEITDPKEVVFTWEDPDKPGQIRMWCVNRIMDWCKRTNRQILQAAVEAERAEWFIENRGIEQHRIDWLFQNQDHIFDPCLMMRMPTSGRDEVPFWDLMLDGHHRYVALAMGECPFFRLYHVSEEEAKPFEVTGMPQPNGPLNIHAFSGIGEKDHD